MRKNDTLSNIALQAVRDFAVALALLSRLPIKISPDEFDRGARAAWAYPLVGAFLAAIAGTIAMLVISIGISIHIAAIISIAILILLSGAMHEDGLADTADGLWGGWDRITRLKIMKDSQIGTYGVLALGIFLALRMAALAVIFGAGTVILPLVAAALISRAAMVAVMAALPGARDSGLGHSTGRPSNSTAGLAILVALVGAVLCLGWGGVIAAICAAVVAVFVAMIARAKIGGQTGDILGATQQCAEIAVLLWLAI